MRVLLITDWVTPSGGVETYLPILRQGLRGEGDEVRLLTSSAAAPEQASPDYLAYGSRRLAAQIPMQVVNPFAVARVRSALREFRPDVVQVQMFALHLSPAIFGPLSSVPTVLYVNEYKPVCPTSWKLLPNGSRCTDPAGLVCWRNGCTSLPHWLRDRPRYALIGAGIRRVDRVLACGRSVQHELGVKGIESEVLHLPVPAPDPGFRRRPAAEPLFAYSGRLSEEKGLSLLLRAFARVGRSMPSARLRLIGEGPERAPLERLAHELGISAAVSFRGRVPPERVGDELSDPWALVAPSLHAEPLGLAVLEGLVHGVPVIASATGGFSETVEEGLSGLLFANGDETELVGSLEAVAHGRAFPSRRIADDVVRRVSAEHSLEGHVRRIRRIHAEVLAA